MPNPTTVSSLDRGDLAARNEEWTTATKEWTHALHGSDRDAARSRLTWFLEQENIIERPVLREGRERRRAYRWVLIAITGSIVGTALVLINVEVDGGPSSSLSVLAWVAFLVAMAATLIFARRIGQAGEAHSGRSLSSGMLGRAHAAARVLDQQTQLESKPRRRSSR